MKAGGKANDSGSRRSRPARFRRRARGGRSACPAGGVAADVADAPVVAPRIAGGVDHAVAGRAADALPDCVSQTTGGLAGRRPPAAPATGPSTPWPTISPAGDRCAARRSRDRRSPPAPAARRCSPRSSSMRMTRAPGTTRRDAAPPNSPRTSPNSRAPGTKTRSPTRARCASPPRRCGRPIRSRAPADSPCRETAACGRTTAAARCRC